MAHGRVDSRYMFVLAVCIHGNADPAVCWFVTFWVAGVRINYEFKI